MSCGFVAGRGGGCRPRALIINRATHNVDVFHIFALSQRENEGRTEFGLTGLCCPCNSDHLFPASSALLTSRAAWGEINLLHILKA